MKITINKISPWLFETTDKKLHSTQDAAIIHEKKIAAIKLANEMLEDGCSIAECLAAAGYPNPIHPNLHKLNKSTRFIDISIDCGIGEMLENYRFIITGKFPKCGYFSCGLWSVESLTSQSRLVTKIVNG